MLLVIPVSQEDKGLIEVLKLSLATFSPGQNHDLLVVGSPNVAEEVKALASDIAPHFTSAKYFIFSQDSEMGWPLACNFYFQQTAYHVSTILEDGKGWLWFELDCTPLKKNWLDQIEFDYYEERKTAYSERREPNVFMGAKCKTYVEQEKQLLPEDQAGFHMNGCGVYPSNLPSLTPLLRSVNVSGRTPFDVYIQWYVTPLLLVSKFFQNNHKTANYRRDGEQIVCDSIHNWSWDIHFNAPVSDEALILHGCKDGTLAHLLAEPTLAPKQPEPSKAPDWPSLEPQKPVEAPEPSSVQQSPSFNPQKVSEEPTPIMAVESIPEPTPTVDTSVPILGAPKKSTVSAKYKRKPLNLTPMERRRRAERMRALHQSRKNGQILGGQTVPA